VRSRHGNCAILKPSELAPRTSQIITDIIQKTFDPAYIAAVEGGAETSQQLLAEKFDHIFSPAAPKLVKLLWRRRLNN
jgi:aldehyde dehydrogenase (NAD+)